jgi:UDP-N-acetylmuramate: L-alanyl-gamma-D-glutamyl-meso-diaminopimelate ligase
MRIHLIAIGGAVMHQLAISLHLQGHNISGSDDEIFDPALSNLRKHGLINDNFSWDSNRITKEIDIIILGMHAKADNPELLKAQELGIRCVSFPEFIYEHSKTKKRVVVGGSHGKTTITSMIMHVLKESGKHFDYLVGSKIRGFDVMVSLSNDADLIIIEGDEYLSSTLDPRPKFHLYKPDIAVISGIEWDHINVFPRFDIYQKQFEIFASMISENGVLIYTADDKNVENLVQELNIPANKIPYTAIPYNIENGKTKVLYNSVPIEVNVFGEHNMKNLSAALEVCRQLGVADASFFASIASFNGAARRLECIFDNGHSSIYRDFAHAPSKVKATVSAMKKKNPERQLLAVFELHTFSSMNKTFLHQYAGSMDAADIAIVFFSPHAFALKRLEMFDDSFVKEAFCNKNISVFNNINELESSLQNIVNSNTNVLLMSSGNFDGMKIELLFDKLEN